MLLPDQACEPVRGGLSPASGDYSMADPPLRGPTPLHIVAQAIDVVAALEFLTHLGVRKQLGRQKDTSSE